MKLLIAGDFAPRERVLEKIRLHSCSDVLAEIKPYTAQSDFSIVNLEAPIVIHSERSQPIPKVGPSLSAPPESLDMLVEAGFNCLTLANNHIMDYGPSALDETLSLLREKELSSVGAGDNLDAAGTPLYLTKNAETIAIVNFCEHEFSIAGENSPGAFPLDPVQNYRQIQEAKQHADHVVVIVHGGHEHFSYPSPRMVDTYRFFIDAGADAVVNHHQHCPCGYELYQGKPIFYGLGNFCIDSPNRHGTTWCKGYFVMLELGSGTVRYSIVPYTQCDGEPLVHVLRGSDLEEFNAWLQNLNEAIADRDKLNDIFSKYARTRTFEMLFRFSPYSGRICRYLRRKHLLPTGVNNRKALVLMNSIGCEAHRDVSLSVLQEFGKKG